MRRLLALVVIAAFALGACTGGEGDDDSNPVVTGGGTQDGGDDGTGDVDPCALLTTEEVEVAVGNPVEDGAADAGLGTCTWATDPDATSASAAFLGVGVPQVCADALEADSANEEIEGFDDRAYWSFVPTGGGVGTITACTSEGQLVVTVTGGLDDDTDEAGVRAAAEDLTGRALARL
jgi:hypothetical protein